MIEEALLEAEEKMDTALDVARSHFAEIRTGRANAAMFNSIQVEYYGAPTPLQQLASFNIPEARTVLITPFDRSATNEIIRAIRDSDLGVNPNDDGKVIRVVLPALTEERRKDYVRMARGKAEDARIAVRGVRRKAMDILGRIERDGDAGKDEVERAERELQQLTDRYVGDIDQMLAAKEEELLTI